MSIEAELKRTLKALVAIDSTSSKSNLPMLAYLEPRLTAAGFRCERVGYRDEQGVEKANLLATRGDGTPALGLVGHTDCVPFDPAWTEALALTEKDGKLYGRGACDTKAFIACALVAAERSRARAPLAVWFTADEEVGCVGAKQLVERKVRAPRRAIVGEPTSLHPVRANKGYCLGEVEVHGVEGHSAYPEKGASAIFRAARFLSRLEALAATELAREADAAFSPPHTTINVGLISGGKAKNIIPGSCRFTIEWRPIPQQPVERVLKLLERVRDELVAAEPGFRCDIRPLRTDVGADTPAQAELVQFLSSQTRAPPITVAFGTEAPQMIQLGAEAVVFGPGDIRTAHRTGEYVPIDELVRCEQILESTIAHFCQ